MATEAVVIAAAMAMVSTLRRESVIMGQFGSSQASSVHQNRPLQFSKPATEGQNRPAPNF
jgi:hypothetical protein